MATYDFAGTAQEIKFGVKAGLNIASVKGKNLPSLDSRASFHAGAFAEFGVADKFAIQPELLYSSQGAKASSSGEGQIILDYLQLPVMAKYTFIEGVSL